MHITEKVVPKKSRTFREQRMDVFVMTFLDGGSSTVIAHLATFGKCKCMQNKSSLTQTPFICTLTGPSDIKISADGRRIGETTGLSELVLS